MRSFKDFLKEERAIGLSVGRSEEDSIDLAAERYSNQNKRMADAGILSFYAKVKDDHPALAAYFKEFFNITVATRGEI